MNADNVVVESKQCPECGGGLAEDAVFGLCPVCLLRQGVEESPAQTGQPAARTTPPGFVAPEPRDLTPLFPQLEILKLLGQGGMGAVYKCRQTKLDRPVALKVLPDHSGEGSFADRFAREARALARLDHSGIVHIHDFGDADGLHYFIMEYVDGIDLRQLLHKGPLAPEQALSIIGQIADALQYAHEEGIVHRDIKPENILLDRRGRVRLADFGLAKLVGPSPIERSLTGTHQIMGTPHYMAPEQFEKPNQVDQRADIYALGVVFYEMLTGELPLGQFVPPSHKSRVSPRIDEIVLRALAREPERRFQRIDELQAALAALQAPREGTPVIGKVPSVPFSCAGFASELRGRIHLEDQELVLEFQRFVFGCLPLRINESRIPLKEIESIQVSGSWGLTITLETQRLAPLAQVPTAQGGRLVLLVKADDREAAGRFLKALNRVLPSEVFPPADAALASLLEMQVRLPAAFLMAVGIATLLHSFIVFMLPVYKRYYGEEVLVVYGVAGAEMLVGTLIVMGARRMLRLQRYEFAVVAACLAFLPVSFAAFAGIPVGCWALAVLRRQQVKLAFLGRPEPESITPKVLQPAGPVQRKARSILGNLYSLMFESRVRPEDQETSLGDNLPRSAE
ncbi:MAG: serine/threonine-protein kinase [Gemmataceae bacterium]